mmetsp:Transcript_17261/g.43068  ORF Transcript_17261/g.43068 Transcript_17261/m.43068 type:complete len:283 (-) Transcript_17261:418-1266(-)
MEKTSDMDNNNGTLILQVVVRMIKVVLAHVLNVTSDSRHIGSVLDPSLRLEMQGNLEVSNVFVLHDDALGSVVFGGVRSPPRGYQKTNVGLAEPSHVLLDDLWVGIVVFSEHGHLRGHEVLADVSGTPVEVFAVPRVIVRTYQIVRVGGVVKGYDFISTFLSLAACVDSSSSQNITIEIHRHACAVVSFDCVDMRSRVNLTRVSHDIGEATILVPQSDHSSIHQQSYNETNGEQCQDGCKYQPQGKFGVALGLFFAFGFVVALWMSVVRSSRTRVPSLGHRR